MLKVPVMRRIFSTGTVLMAVASMSWAQDYPNRPIRFIVPYPPGGATTLTARVVSQKMSEAWGQQIIIDNRGGAATIVGTELAARAAPDGYTILLGNFGWAVTPAFHEKLPYNVVRDFATVSLIANGSLALLVPPSSPVKSVKELIALAQAKPGQLNYGSSGGGSSSNLGALLFQSMTGTRMTAVNYQGGGPMVIALLGRELNLIFVSISAVMSHIKSGQLRVLGVSTLKRSRALPDVPTIAESGIAGYELNSWYGVVVPTGTPQRIITKLNEGVVQAVKSPDAQEILINQGLEPDSSPAAEFSKYFAKEVAKWTKLIKETGARHD